MRSRRLLLIVVPLAACSRQVGGPGTPEAPLHERWSFEGRGASIIPGWEQAETNGQGTPGRWMVATDSKVPEGSQILRLFETRNSGSTFNLFLAPGVWPADLRLSVHLRADAGEEDQGGGLLWRARGQADYYVTRWNPLEDNLRLYKVVGGVRTMLASAEFQADPRAWHRLEIEARGPEMRVRFDGIERLRIEDETFTEGGRIGLWTKADAATSFDLLEVAALP